MIKFYLLFFLTTTLNFSDKKVIKFPPDTRPKIAFTFDDPNISDMPGYPLEVWNQSLLHALNKHQLKAVLFVTGMRIQGKKGADLLKEWNRQGHKISNHTYSHLNYADSENTVKQFESELLRNHSIIKKYSNFYPYFRFPYLKEGNTRGKTDSLRSILHKHGYKNGHVTIDASDWYVNSRLVQRLKKDPKGDISGYKSFYIEHLFDRALYYDSLASGLTNRKINHVILLHHNLAAALFLDDLIQHFKDRGWDVVDAEKAYQDEVYKQIPNYIPAGESLIWAMAKQSGLFEKSLRYPGEDGEYEKVKMDRLKL
ncbi:MAG: polysaccharide deacetylase family protein [Saprospiraceae bacterium]